MKCEISHQHEPCSRGTPPGRKRKFAAQTGLGDRISILRHRTTYYYRRLSITRDTPGPTARDENEPCSAASPRSGPRLHATDARIALRPAQGGPRQPNATSARQRTNSRHYTSIPAPHVQRHYTRTTPPPHLTRHRLAAHMRSPPTCAQGREGSPTHQWQPTSGHVVRRSAAQSRGAQPHEWRVRPHVTSTRTRGRHTRQAGSIQPAAFSRQPPPRAHITCDAKLVVPLTVAPAPSRPRCPPNFAGPEVVIPPTRFDECSNLASALKSPLSCSNWPWWRVLYALWMLLCLAWEEEGEM